MKSIIIYYSQTGNTRKIARAIHRGARTLLEKCHIAPIKEVKPKDLDNYDLIGLGSPVWMGAEPPNVRLFTESLPDQKGKHLFSFCTHGTMPELYFPTVVRRLKSRNYTVIGTRDWYGGSPGPEPYYTDGHPDEIDLKEAEEFGREMVEISHRISAGEKELIPPVPEHVLTPQLLVFAEFYRCGHNPHGRLTYNPKKCAYPKCTICMENCTMNYIDLSVDPPIFGDKGTECDNYFGCTFCEMICPTGAISGDWEELSNLNQNIMRALDLGYNILEKPLDDAEAAGRFRRLVPKEKVKMGSNRFDHKRPLFKIPKDG